MRLAYVCADRGVPVLGGKGASVHVRAVTTALTQGGHNVVLACARVGAGDPPPDVAELIELEPSEDARLRQLAALLAVREIEAVIERYSLSCGTARAAAHMVGIPLVLEVNAPLVLEAAQHRGLEDVEPWLAWEARTFGSADAIGVVSSSLGYYVQGVAPAVRVSTVPNGVDPERFSSAQPADLGIPPGAAVVGFVGSMKAWHGVVDLVDAVASLATPRVHLVLAGEGPELAAATRRAAERGIDGRLRVLGQVPERAIPSVLTALDVGAAPYRLCPDFYFSPLKVMEYLAAGLPVVCPALGDLPAIVGEAGLLYPGGDLHALTAALDALVSDGARRKAAQGAAIAIGARSTWAANATAYAGLAAGAVARIATAERAS